MKRGGHGYGTRYDQIDAQEARLPGPGHGWVNYNCEICGRNRSIGNHIGCSKIRAKKYREARGE